MLLFNMSFWSTVCIFVCLCIVTQLSYAKFNTGECVLLLKNFLRYNTTIYNYCICCGLNLSLV